MKLLHAPSRPLTPALLFVLLAVKTASAGQQASGWNPEPETLDYTIEWHMVTAGAATVRQSRNGSNWNFDMKLESAGIVNRLYHVLDTYQAVMTGHFCGINIFMDAQEGKKHIQTRLDFDNTGHKVSYDERNFTNKNSQKMELDIQPCTYDIIGALVVLRTEPPAVGKPVILPITDGKKFAMAKIEALGKESLKISGKSYSTVRYEGFVFDNVLYKRKGRLFIWLTDDTDHVPVQFQIHAGFPIGNVNAELTKRE